MTEKRDMVPDCTKCGKGVLGLLDPGPFDYIPSFQRETWGKLERWECSFCSAVFSFFVQDVAPLINMDEPPKE